MASFGISFTDPFQNNAQQNGPAPSGPGASSAPLQSAVQLLSLRLPRFQGIQQGAMAPGALLQGRGGGAMSPEMWAQLLQRLQQAGGAMTPRVTPGVQAPPSGPAIEAKMPGSGMPSGSLSQPAVDPPTGPWPGNPTPPTGLPGSPWGGNPFGPRGGSY